MNQFFGVLIILFLALGSIGFISFTLPLYWQVLASAGVVIVAMVLVEFIWER